MGTNSQFKAWEPGVLSRLIYFSYCQSLPWVKNTGLIIHNDEINEFQFNPDVLNCKPEFGTNDLKALAVQPKFVNYLYDNFISSHMDICKDFKTTESELYWIYTYRQIMNFSVTIAFDYEKISISVNEDKGKLEKLILDMDMNFKNVSEPVFTWYDKIETGQDALKFYVVWDLMLHLFEYILKLTSEDNRYLSQLKLDKYKFVSDHLKMFDNSLS